jgi:hypothetical protein
MTKETKQSPKEQYFQTFNLIGKVVFQPKARKDIVQKIERIKYNAKAEELSMF